MTDTPDDEKVDAARDDEKIDELEEEIKVVFDYEDAAGRAMSSLTVNPDASGPTSHSIVTKVQKRRHVMDPRLVGCYCTSAEVQGRDSQRHVRYK